MQPRKMAVSVGLSITANGIAMLCLALWRLMANRDLSFTLFEKSVQEKNCCMTMVTAAKSALLRIHGWRVEVHASPLLLPETPVYLSQWYSWAVCHLNEFVVKCCLTTLVPFCLHISLHIKCNCVDIDNYTEIDNFFKKLLLTAYNSISHTYTFWRSTLLWTSEARLV